MYWITGILGLLLVVAPFGLNYSADPNALWSSIILGLIVLLASIWAGVVRGSERWQYWVAGIAGLLQIIAPWALGFSALTTATWTSVILGVIVAILCGYEAFSERAETMQPTTR